MHSLFLHFYKTPLKFSRDQGLPDKFSSIPWMVKGLSLGKLGENQPVSHVSSKEGTHSHLGNPTEVIILPTQTRHYI